MAKGLIPLMLASSATTSSTKSPSSINNRYSCPPPSRTPDLRRQSTPNGLSFQFQPSRPRPTKRFSLPTPAALPMVPYSPAEWKKAIGEIKRMHFSRRYRACSVRCIEILDSIKDRSQVEPVYLIYLHFYAATSKEMCARPLPANSPLRTHFLQEARNHFDRAATLINAAEESVLSKFRPGSVNSSRGSSCHSPSGSISSRSWTPDSRMSSPTTSVCSFDDLSGRLNSPKRVKKVSFSLPKEETIQIPEPIHFSEPYIRPDSPTLGIDEYLQAGIAKQELPELPVPQSPLKFQEVEWPLHTIPECEEEDMLELSSEEDDESSYMIARSVDRCCEHLSGLRTQLVRHAASLDESLSPTAASTEATQFMDKATRIERLRKIGWQRKRFDPRRYEELCEAVIAELS
ncbi:hypothetical protein QBC38DRAFT_212764 [Podospora fimiseda]|uniref:Uncharacterized protein n=1 Tax=Podospora fimiseda TaxID=252190 RepID=A0AAN7H1S7_9PEZI|nr:hypothetical protein QBC38DRAFT_212764 [Podospora fimiseda]